MYSRFVDNGKFTVLTSAPREDGFPPKCKTSTGNEFDFRSPSPSQKSALLKVPIACDEDAISCLGRHFVPKINEKRHGDA